MNDVAYRSPQPRHVMVTGGAGYVGSCLVPKLLAAGHDVTVLDLFLFGPSVFGHAQQKHPNLQLIRGDMRNEEAVKRCSTFVVIVDRKHPAFSLRRYVMPNDRLHIVANVKL